MRSTRRSLALAAGLAAGTCIVFDAGAATLFSSGAKPWDTGTTANWGAATGGPYNTNTWTAGDDAVFEGTAGTVTVAAGGVNASSLTFSTTGYTVGSNTLTLGGATPGVTVNATTATISSAVAGSGLTKSGTGTLVLQGANTYTGATTVSQGILQLSTQSIASTSGYTVNDANTGANATTLRFAGGFTGNRTGVGSISLRDVTPITIANQGSGTTTLEIDSSAAGWVNGTVTLNKAVTLRSAAGGGVRAGFTTFSGPGAGAGNDTLIYDATGSGNDANWNTFENVGTYVPQPNTFTGNVRFTGGQTIIQNKAYANAAFTNLNIPDTASVTIDAGSTLNFAWGTEAFDALNGAGTLLLSNTNDVGGAIRTVTIGQSGGSGSFSGVITNGTGTSPGLILVKNGGGTQTLSGASTYTGSTTVNDGRLAIGGAAERISNSSALILGGGTFDTGGLSETLSTLQITASSSIDLGSGASVLTFAASDTQAWTGTLTIHNWSGSLSGGGTDRLVVGNSATGLTATQLSQINFNGFGSGAQILSSGEVVPVPEPAAVGLIGLAVAGMAMRRRRRRLPGT